MRGPRTTLATTFALRHRTAERQGNKRNAGALQQQIDTRSRRGAIGAGQGYLLADNRSQVAVERKQELLDIAPRTVRIRFEESPRPRWAGTHQRSRNGKSCRRSRLR